MRFTLWLSTLALSACASGQVQLPPGVTTSGQFLERIEASYQGSGSVADAQKCAALELTNPDVLVSGTAGGVLLPGLPTAQVLPGSGVVQQVGDDFLVARAAAEYNVLGGITSRVVRFSLLLEFTNGQVKATAGDITQTQRDAGIGAPSGFRRVGTWPGAGGADAANAVRSEIDQVVRCIRPR